MDDEMHAPMDADLGRAVIDAAGQQLVHEVETALRWTATMAELRADGIRLVHRIGDDDGRGAGPRRAGDPP